MINDVEYKYINVFEPLPWQVEPWRDKSDTLLLTGSAGGGKSRLAGEKLHAYCLKYPGSTALVLRKVRASMANSTLLFLSRHVIGKDPRVKHRMSDFRFEYENGSILAYGGMKDDDQRERIRSIGQSGGLDIVWMEEATQFEEGDYNEVLARMRGYAADWNQIILTTNPDAPGHWINIRLIQGGEASSYFSSALDNVHNPEHYHETLKKLRGVQYRRLVLGEWTEGSGAVIDTWLNEYNTHTGDDNGGNVSNRAEYMPDGGPVVWVIDDGYSGKMDKKTGMFSANSHPRAILFCQLRSDGRISVFAESVKSGILASAHLDEALATSRVRGWERPAYVVHDKAAAALSGALKDFSLRPRYNQISVDEGVKVLREWVAADDNGFRRILVHPRCFYLKYEMQSYSYDDNGRIIKAHDHTIDALRYLVWELEHGAPAAVDVAVMDDAEIPDFAGIGGYLDV